MGGMALGGDLLDKLCRFISNGSAPANDAMSSDKEYAGSIVKGQSYSRVWNKSFA